MRFIVLAALAAALAACATAPADNGAPAVRLYALDCGTLDIADADMFADDGSLAGQARTAVDPCYLIRHPDGDLMWDAGLPEMLADAPDGMQAGPFTLRMARSLTAQLADLGLTPADIDFFAASHTHFDHVGNAGLFAGATWLVDADERAFAFRDEARADAQTFPFYAALESADTIQFDGDHDVFGDGAVVILAAPGHTPGHAMLKVTLPQAGVVLLTGDLFHMPESRANRLVPRFNTDRAQTLASMDRLEALAAQWNARVVRQHVPEDFAALPAFPAPLE